MDLSFLLLWTARLALSAAALFPAQRPVPEPLHDGPRAQAVRTLRQLRDPAAPPPAELAQAVAADDRGVLATLLGTLSTGRVPAVDAAGEQALSEVQEELVLDVFERAGKVPALAAIAALPTDAAHVGERRAAIRVLGAVGGVDELARALALARVPGEDAPAQAVLASLEAACTSLLAREPACYDYLGGAWERLDPEVLVPVLRAVGRVGSPAGLPLLRDVLEWREDVSALAMDQVQRIGPSTDEMVNATLAERVRDHLVKRTHDARDRTVCRSAALALGALEDARSIPLLIDLLESDDAGIAENALWGLRRATGLTFPAHAPLWRSWHAEEVLWFRRDRARTFALLDSPRVPDVLEAVRVIGERRLYRHALALELAQHLPHPAPSVRAAIARALGELGSRCVVPDLQGLLDDPDASVQSAAAESIALLTGRRPDQRVAAR